MSEISKVDHGHTAARALPLVLPMPHAFYLSAGGSRRWFALDPVFASQCIALCRSMRLTVLALIAFVSGPRTLRAGHAKASQEINAPSADASHDAAEAARQTVRAARLARLNSRTEPTIGASVLQSLKLPAKDTAKLTKERTHAPPAFQTQTAFRSSLQNLPPPSFVSPHPSARNISQQNSSQFVVQRTHAPPSNPSSLHRSSNRTKPLQRSTPQEIASSVARRLLPCSAAFAGASLNAVAHPAINHVFGCVGKTLLPAKLSVPHLRFTADLAAPSPRHFLNMHCHTGIAWSVSGEPIPAPGEYSYVRFEFGHFVLTIAAFLAAVHGLGYLAERLRQPRIVGEILAGVLLGPFVLKPLMPGTYARLFTFAPSASTALGFLYQFGLILLMFCSGAETRRLLAKENRNKTLLLITVSDAASFIFVLGLGFLGFIPLARLTGTAGQQTSALLVLAIATSVTSIPVISRIFWDLGIMRTRFVSLLLGYAVLEDIALWIVLAFAMALAKSATLVHQNIAGTVSSHVLSTFLYMAVAMGVMPALLRRISGARWNILNQASPVGYVVFVLMFYCGIAGLVDVNLQFAALLAGFGIVGGIRGTERDRFAVQIDAVAKVSFGVFIPLYFGMVGYRLVFGRQFSLGVLLVFFFASSAIAIASSSLAARLGGFRGLDIVNIAITTNARGGPGIVLASVAFDAGIINAAFYTALVITAVVTSQVCGIWLRSVLTRGLPLLSSNPEETWQRAGQTIPVAAEEITT